MMQAVSTFPSLDSAFKTSTKGLNALSSKNADKEILADQALDYLREIEDASSYIYDIDTREELLSIVRFWSSVIYENKGFYPKITLRPSNQPKAEAELTQQGLRIPWIKIVFFLQLLLWVFVFRYELVEVIRLIDNNLFRNFYSEEFLGKRVAAVALLTTNLAAIILLALFSILIFSQSLFPVKTLSERIYTFFHLLFATFGKFGITISAKEGKIIGRERKNNSKFPGFAFIDSESAIVFEKSKPYKSGCLFRVQGPGFTVIVPGEKVKGSVNLRKQIRLRSDIHAHTRDGIEVKSHVFAMVTLGQEPDVIKVTYVGDEETPNNLRVLQLGYRNPDHEEATSTSMQKLIMG
jgi:hypothetical protein